MNIRVISPAFAALLLSHGVAAPPRAPANKPTLTFLAYNGDPKKTDPKEMTFQINTPGSSQPSQFLQLGDLISQTNWRLQSFQYKTRIDPKYVEVDVSELTLVNTITKETKVLTLHAASK
jgi:hypothetical protein